MDTDKTDPTAVPRGSAPAAATVPPARVRPLIVEAINQSVPGTLTLHYKSRDIVMRLPGDVALRLITAFRRNRTAGLDDPVDLSSTLALDGYVAMTLEGLLAVTWEPGRDAEEVVGPALMAALDRIDDSSADAPPEEGKGADSVGDE